MGVALGMDSVVDTAWIMWSGLQIDEKGHSVTTVTDSCACAGQQRHVCIFLTVKSVIFIVPVEHGVETELSLFLMP